MYARMKSLAYKQSENTMTRYTNKTCSRCKGQGTLANEIREGGICFACNGTSKAEAKKAYFGITQQAEQGYEWKVIIRAYDEQDACQHTKKFRDGEVTRCIQITRKQVDEFIARFDSMYIKRKSQVRE